MELNLGDEERVGSGLEGHRIWRDRREWKTSQVGERCFKCRTGGRAMAQLVKGLLCEREDMT